jgi:hypothetical protein
VQLQPGQQVFYNQATGQYHIVQQQQQAQGQGYPQQQGYSQPQLQQPQQQYYQSQNLVSQGHQQYYENYPDRSPDRKDQNQNKTQNQSNAPFIPDEELSSGELRVRQKRSKRNSQIEQMLQQNSNQYYNMANLPNNYVNPIEHRKNQLSHNQTSHNTENYYNN